MEVILLFVAFVALAGLGFAVWWFGSDQVGRRRLLKAVSTRIAEAPEGALVKITGTLVPVGDDHLEGPLTGRSCVGFVIEVKEHRQSGAHANWETLVSEEDAVAFVVDDGSGRAFVKASGAHLVLVRDGHVRSGSMSDHSERADAFLAKHAIWEKKTVRYEEGVLEPGEEVSVLGVARREVVPADQRWDGAPDEWLVLSAPDAGPLTISDDPATL